MNCDRCKREPGRFKMAKMPLGAEYKNGPADGRAVLYLELVDICHSCYKKLTRGEAPDKSITPPAEPKVEKPIDPIDAAYQHTEDVTLKEKKDESMHGEKPLPEVSDESAAPGG